MPSAKLARPVAPAWIFHGLLFAVALIPLPLGGVYQWSWAGLAVLLGGLLLAWLLAVWRRQSEIVTAAGGIWLPAILFLGVALWIALQAAGLGPADWTAAIWQDSAETLGEPVARAISLNPGETWSGLLQLLTYEAIFWLALQYGRAPGLARRGLWLLAIVGAAYALYGLASVLSGAEKVLWFEKTAYRGNATGTFINRNMYAFYAGLGLLSSCALLMERYLAARRRTAGHGKALLRTLAEGPNQVAVLAVMILIYLVAISFTESRGGALSSASAVAVLVVTLLWRRAPLRLGPLLLAAAVLIAVWLSIYAVTAAHLGGRFQTQFFDDGGRFDAYAIMLSAIRDASLQGYGYGAFVDMFYHRNDGAIWLPYNYAHNLYLGAVVDLGIPASLGLFGAVLLVTLACIKGIWSRRRHRVYPALGLAATSLVAVHGLVDSPLFMPANAATYSFILGLAYAQATPTRSKAC